MKFTHVALLLSLGSASAFMGPTAGSGRTSSALGSIKNLLETRTGRSQLDPAVVDRFSQLPFPEDKILAEYVWVDAVGNTRSKTRTLPAKKVSTHSCTQPTDFGDRPSLTFILPGKIDRNSPQMELRWILYWSSTWRRLGGDLVPPAYFPRPLPTAQRRT